jgi:hypothetical protein
MIGLFIVIICISLHSDNPLADQDSFLSDNSIAKVIFQKNQVAIFNFPQLFIMVFHYQVEMEVQFILIKEQQL